jgi:hypothetical protein
MQFAQFLEKRNSQLDRQTDRQTDMDGVRSRQSIKNANTSFRRFCRMSLASALRFVLTEQLTDLRFGLY